MNVVPGAGRCAAAWQVDGGHVVVGDSELDRVGKLPDRRVVDVPMAPCATSRAGVGSST